MAKTEALSIDLLRTDAGTQARLKTNSDTVDDYAEVIEQAGSEWPFGPIDVFHDGVDYFVADGFHRILAAQRTNRASVPCILRRGTAKDAKIFGMTANDRHGLRMTRADKRACVEWLLDNGGKLTQVEIAAKAGVCKRTVAGIIADRRTGVQSSEKVQIAPSNREYAKHGKPSPEPKQGFDNSDADFESPDEGEPDADPAPVSQSSPAKQEKQVTPAEQAKLNKRLASDLIARAVRAVDDLNFVKPNPIAKKVVKMLQDAGEMLW